MTRNDETALAGAACRCSGKCSVCSCHPTTDPANNQDYLARVRASIRVFAAHNRNKR
jgi:hypothetical protein